MKCTILDCRRINCLKGLFELFIFRRTPYSVKLILEGLKRFFERAYDTCLEGFTDVITKH